MDTRASTLRHGVRTSGLSIGYVPGNLNCGRRQARPSNHAATRARDDDGRDARTGARTRGDRRKPTHPVSVRLQQRARMRVCLFAAPHLQGEALSSVQRSFRAEHLDLPSVCARVRTAAFSKRAHLPAQERARSTTRARVQQHDVAGWALLRGLLRRPCNVRVPLASPRSLSRCVRARSLSLSLCLCVRVRVHAYRLRSVVSSSSMPAGGSFLRSRNSFWRRRVYSCDMVAGDTQTRTAGERQANARERERGE